MKSCVSLRVQQPPAVRLVDSNSHRHAPSRSSTPATRPGTPAPLTTAEADILASLSLSSKPVITPVKPIFGHSSLTQPPPSNNAALDTDAMDWTPTSGVHSAVAEETDSWLRPQRFFAPEKPTGLEGLFERALLVDDAPREPSRRAHIEAGLRTYGHGYLWYLLILIPTAIGYKIWDTRREESASFDVDSL